MIYMTKEQSVEHMKQIHAKKKRRQKYEPILKAIGVAVLLPIVIPVVAIQMIGYFLLDAEDKYRLGRKPS